MSDFTALPHTRHREHGLVAAEILMKLSGWSGVLFVLGFVCMVLLKTQPEWLFGEKPQPTHRFREVHPVPMPEPIAPAPQLRPIHR